MIRWIFLFSLMAFVAPLSAMPQMDEPKGQPLISPDHHFEVYEMPAWSAKNANGAIEYLGTRLYLRAAGSKTKGGLVRQNDRWMDIQWCPHTSLLGVEDHFDGHQSDIFVYEVSAAKDRGAIVYRHVFRSPGNEYDRQWFIEGWDAAHRIIHLRMEQWNHSGLDPKKYPPGYFVRHRSFAVGTISLCDDQKGE